VDKSLIGRIVPELETALTGRRFGRVFQPSKSEFVIDLRLNDSKYLFISIDPGRPRIFLATRRLKDLDKTSINSTAFVMQLKKQLANAVVTAVTRVPDERVVILTLDREDDLGGNRPASLAVQLTGRSSNLFILGEHGTITDRARETNGSGQEIGDVYSPPARPTQERSTDPQEIELGAGDSFRASRSAVYRKRRRKDL
jgi:predicted ribosome quality control (RQC) complex YloA/Tae2 family protein